MVPSGMRLGPLIGAAMAVRSTDLAAIGYFHSDNHDDMDMCHRLRDRFPKGRVMFEPSAIVRHQVPKNRLTWSYFWRRCFFVNRGKVAAFEEMGGARNLDAERRFVMQAITVGVRSSLQETAEGDPSGVLRGLCLAASLVLAGLGYLTGMGSGASAPGCAAEEAGLPSTTARSATAQPQLPPATSQPDRLVKRSQTGLARRPSLWYRASNPWPSGRCGLCVLPHSDVIDLH